jgi:cell wall assembly regulator SMI1
MAMTNDFRYTWSLFETALRAAFPLEAATLQPGVSSLEIDRVARDVGAALNAEIQALYACANGQSTRGGVFDLYRFLPLEDASREYQTLCTNALDWNMSETEWNSGWFPFAEGPGGGDFLCVDSTGAGQIVEYRPRRIAPRRSVSESEAVSRSRDAGD